MKVVQPNQSIEERGGLKVVLDEDYAGKGGYDEFVKRLNLDEPKTVIANAFGVHRHTIVKWIEIYSKEQRDEHS